MKISVITVSYNSAQTIEDTIKSVISQKGVSLEYIIVDGGSTDGTEQILENYRDHISILIRGKDKGIYDAMNKGVAAATSDIIAILNSDDFYTNAGVLKKVVDCFTMGDIDACFGDIDYVKRRAVYKDLEGLTRGGKQVVRRWKAGEFEAAKLSFGWIPPHPAFFVKKALYSKFGPYNTAFSIAADYEWMLRALLKGIKTSYIPESLVCMRRGGHSASSFLQRTRGWKELRKAWIVNGKKTPRFFITKRILSKLHQYIV